MAGFKCPHCGESIDVFAPAPADRAIWAHGVPLLGRIPLDANVMHRTHEFDRLAGELVARLDTAE